MLSFVIDLVVGVFDFFLDVFTFRRLREHRGHRERSFGEDAQAVASFDLMAMGFICLVAVGLILALKFLFGLPLGLSIGIGVAVGVIWAVWRYMRMVNEP